MTYKKALEKIYFKLTGLDFNHLSFQNHILLNEILNDIKALTQESDESTPPPIPMMESADNVVALKTLPRRNSLRLMILDEDADIQSMVEYSLRGETNIDLHMERSPRKALKLIAQQKPHIILFDIQMKEMTSYEFLLEIKKLDPNRDIEIIAGSHHPNQHEKNAALELGVSDYIAKPYDLLEVRFKLQLRIEKKKQCGS